MKKCVSEFINAKLSAAGRSGKELERWGKGGGIEKWGRGAGNVEGVGI